MSFESLSPREKVRAALRLIPRFVMLNPGQRVDVFTDSIYNPIPEDFTPCRAPGAVATKKGWPIRRAVPRHVRRAMLARMVGGHAETPAGVALINPFELWLLEQIAE